MFGINNCEVIRYYMNKFNDNDNYGCEKSKRGICIIYKIIINYIVYM